MLLCGAARETVGLAAEVVVSWARRFVPTAAASAAATALPAVKGVVSLLLTWYDSSIIAVLLLSVCDCCLSAVLTRVPDSHAVSLTWYDCSISAITRSQHRC